MKLTVSKNSTNLRDSLALWAVLTGFVPDALTFPVCATSTESFRFYMPVSSMKPYVFSSFIFDFPLFGLYWCSIEACWMKSWVNKWVSWLLDGSLKVLLMQTYQTWECSEGAKVKKVLTWPFIIRLHYMKPGSLGSLWGFLSHATGA